MKASIDAANGAPDAETGFYGELHYAGCETMERAEEIRQALFRAARYLKVATSPRIVQDTDGTYRVIFAAISKEHARRYVDAIPPDKRAYRPGGNSFG